MAHEYVAPNEAARTGVKSDKIGKEIKHGS
jgi:hypothetical protein